MAINFPSLPINNQTHSENGIDYRYDSTTGAWLIITATIPEVAGSIDGQVIFNSNMSSNGSNGLTFSKTANTLYANTVNVTGYIYGNGAFLTDVVSDFSPAYNTANAAFDKANAANVLAYDTGIGANAYVNASTSAANNWANTKLSNTSGVVFGGNLTISQDLSIGNNITNVTSIIFNTSTNRTPTTPGELTWSDDDSTLRFDMDSPSNVIGHIGQDQFYYVKNQTGSTITKGTPVRFAGTLGASGRLLIAPAIANNSYPSKYVVGVAAATINNGDDGFVLAQGKLRGIDTSAFSEGDILYVSSSTPGAFSNTMPTAPNNKITLAAVVKKDNNQGTIEVRLTLGSKLNEDELVEIGTLTDGDTIQYVSANGRFENRQTLVSAFGVANAAFDLANTSSSNSFSTINVSSQGNVTASMSNGVLKLISGGGINITTNTSAKSITISQAITIDYGLIDGVVTAENDYGSIA